MGSLRKETTAKFYQATSQRSHEVFTYDSQEVPESELDSLNRMSVLSPSSRPSSNSLSALRCSFLFHQAALVSSSEFSFVESASHGFIISRNGVLSTNSSALEGIEFSCSSIEHCKTSTCSSVPFPSRSPWLYNRQASVVSPTKM